MYAGRIKEILLRSTTTDALHNRSLDRLNGAPIASVTAVLHRNEHLSKGFVFRFALFCSEED